MRAYNAVVGMLLYTSAALGTDGPPDQKFLVFRLGDESKAVREDGQETVTLQVPPRLTFDPRTRASLGLRPDAHETIAVSPDGRSVAYLGGVENGRALPNPREGSVCLARRDGSEAKVLVGKSAPRGSLSWSPDGTRLAYHESVPTNADPGANVPSSMVRVEIVDVATGVVRRSIVGTTRLTRPKFTGKGNLVYLAFRDRAGKSQFFDIEFAHIVGTIEDNARLSRTLAERQFVLGFDVSADEKSLAFTTPEGLFTRTLGGPQPERRSWKSDEVGAQLGKEWFICFDQPRLRPDAGAVACRCVFIGGRSGSNGGPVPGEDDVVVFPKDGKPSAFKFDPRWTLEGWADRGEVDRIRKR